MLKLNFLGLLKEYEVETDLSEILWNEISNHYSNKHRHYHNLKHLEDIFTELNCSRNKISNWPAVQFSLYYHDIIYKATKKDNEEKSAELASKRMAEVGVSKNIIKLSYDHIIATKHHQGNIDSDTNLFTDADLSILGRNRNTYKIYCTSIRKEYSIYPDFLYKRGRKKVINHFLSLNKIYKTDEFFDKYETQARLNLREELKSL